MICHNDVFYLLPENLFTSWNAKIQCDVRIDAFSLRLDEQEVLGPSTAIGEGRRCGVVPKSDPTSLHVHHQTSNCLPRVVQYHLRKMSVVAYQFRLAFPQQVVFYDLFISPPLDVKSARHSVRNIIDPGAVNLRDVFWDATVITVR